MSRRKEIDERYLQSLILEDDAASSSNDLVLLDRADSRDKEYGEDFDIFELMDSSRDPLTGTLRDLTIDDRDLPLAKNYYEFASKDMAGPKSNMPWARQMWTSLMFFGEVCPVCSRKKYLDVFNVPKDLPTEDLLEHLVLFEHGRCPKCKKTRRYYIKRNLMHNYMEQVLVWGQRSGKSTTAVNQNAYITHRLLKIPRFSEMVNTISHMTPLSQTFVSLTYGKAMTLLWEPYSNTLKDHKWFQDYHSLLDYTGEQQGVELYDWKKEFLKYHHKGLRIHPMNPNKSTLRGDTRVAGTFDELGLFKTPTSEDEEDDESERANADEAHKSVDRSLATIRDASHHLLMKRKFSHIPTGYLMGVSSPFSERDKVMRLLRQSQSDTGSKTMLGSQLATWEVHPTIDKDSPIITSAFSDNRDKAMRDFGAQPPRVSCPFASVELVREGVFIGTANSHRMKYETTEKYITGVLTQVNQTPQPSLMILDAGEVDDSFAVTVMHYDFKDSKTKVTTVVEVIPQEGLRINHNRLYKQLILPLAKDTNTQVILADRWNSLDILHRLEDDMPWKVYVRQISPRRKDFDQVSKSLENRNIILPRPEIPMQQFIEASPENYRTFFVNKPVAHLAHQITTVKEVGPTRPPEKGDGYTDDIYRSFVLGASKIHLPKIKEILEKAKPKRAAGAAVPAMFFSRGGR